MASVRQYLKSGYGQKESVVRTVDECIEKGILDDVLTKHRAEVENMFLTKFDKKMYEEALREEGREELAEENKKLKTRLDEAETRADKAEIEVEELRKEIARLQRK